MKYKFNISNLECANCAKRIEDTLNKDKNIKSASVNFSNLKVTIETDMTKDVLKYVNKIVKKTEDDVEIYETEVKETKVIYDIVRLFIGVLIGIIGLIVKGDILKNILLIISYIILLSKTFIRAIKILVKEKTINENFLITISCVGAYIINKQSEGLMVITLYEIGKILESVALNNSRKSISNLMNIKAIYANLKVGKNIKEVDPKSVNIDDVIVVKTGEKVPLDGIVIKGSAKMNTSALTGESVLKEFKENDKILSGMINVDGLIEVKVTTSYEDSTVNKILELVENATDNKAKTETFVSKAARIYTPLVFILAILVLLYGVIFTKDAFNVWFYKSLVFLVISCPCAIAISVPLSYFAGIGKSSKEGILVKGSNYLDNLRNIKKIVFDKTGTLTTGKFENIKIELYDKKLDENYIKELIVKGESLSNHPIAKSLIELLKVDVDNSDVKNFKEEKGKGISFEIGSDKIKIGSDSFNNVEDGSAYIYISINNKVVASLNVTDKLKDDAISTIKSLKNKNIICEMFTGDSKNNALSVGNTLKLDKINYELLPNEKYELLESYVKDKDVVAFVGDGVNDAPTLALAHIGISMGGIGQESAIEASDVVVMTDELSKIVTSINISKYVSRIIKENLIFAIGVKVLVLILSVVGIASMWQAVFADVGVTLLTILNTMRILRKKID